MRAKRKLIAGVLFVLLGAWIAPALATPALASDAAPHTAVIVQATSEGAAAAAVAAHHGTVTQDLWIVNGVAADVPAGEVAGLAAEPGVTHVSADAAVHVQAADPSPLHAATAVYPKVAGADRLWTEGVDGTGVTVALVDTGITPVADLAGRVIGGVDFSGGNNPYNDEFGHGTFVAGIIAGNGASSNGQYKGVAPDARLVSIKIAGRDGSSDITQVLAAIQWAVSFKSTYGIRVLNLSLGTDSTQPYLLSPLDGAVERAWDAGIVVTVSASNNGPGPGTVTKPADDPLVITVGALDDKGTPGRGDDVMAGFSGEGPTAAVGSGSAALLLDREPNLTPDQVKARLLGTAAPGPVGDPNVDGHGSVDTYAAAHAGTSDSANQGVVRSLGSGSLQLDRGSLKINIQTGTLLDPLFRLLSPVLQPLTGNLTAQNQLFNQVGYFSSAWTGNSWYGSQWGGNSWYSTSWYGNSWYGNSWYGNSWYGNSWYATAWE